MKCKHSCEYFECEGRVQAELPNISSHISTYLQDKKLNSPDIYQGHFYYIFVLEHVLLMVRLTQ